MICKPKSDPWRLSTWLVVGATSIAAFAVEAGVSGYLPLNLSPALEQRVERAMILAGVPTVSRPMRVDTVLSALPKVCERDRLLCRQLRRDLAPYLQAYALTGVGVEGALAGRNTLVQPEQHGEPMSATWAANASGYARFGEHVLMSAGAVAYAGRFTPSGTVASVGDDRVQLDLGYREHWWSPFRLGSMLLGTEAPTMPSATISNPTPWTRAHLHYEMFLGRLSYSERIAYGGGFTSGYPELFGLHLDVEPVPGWSLAVNRLMQFGGGARPHSFSLLYHAFLTPRKYNNSRSAIPEFGNEQFAVSSALAIPMRVPMSVYIEYAAEDAFHAGALRFGSSAVSAGIYLPKVQPNLQLRYEFSEWQSNWYVHHIYQDGVRNDGDALGNWAGDWRQRQDGVGAQSHALELIWDREDGRQWDLQYRTALNASYTGGHYQRSHDLNVSLSRPWRTLLVGAKVQGGRDEYGKSFGRLSAFAQLTGQSFVSRYREPSEKLSADAAEAAEAARSRAGSRTVVGFVDFGLFVSKREFDYNAGQDVPVKTNEGSFHFGFGVRRAYNRHNDFGARIEFDNVKGRLFAAVRAIDYRHHFGPTLAGNLFFGAGRYDAPTPAYGWYAGAGLQWMNVFRNWDVGLDYRVGDHLVRNKTLPSDTVAPRGYDNAFYNIKGESIYISRHF